MPGRKWSEEETARLRVEARNGGTWDQVAMRMRSGRSGVECSAKMTRLNKSKDENSGERRCWDPDEDTQLAGLLGSGRKSWVQIAEAMPGRSASSCRERWVSYLDPGINKEPFTAAEDQTLLSEFDRKGRKVSGSVATIWLAVVPVPSRTPDCSLSVSCSGRSSRRSSRGGLG